MKGYNLVGQTFGRLTVIERVASKGKGREWLCLCTCGNEKIVNTHSLMSGGTRSCGCLEIENLKSGNNRRTHGLSGTRLHRIWKRMKTRCYNKNTNDYVLYGARGIAMCEEWKTSFPCFAEWALLHGYTDELSIDRIDVNGNYEPSNCRWVSSTQQANNKRNNHLITIDGRTQTVTQWISETGMSRATFYQRLRTGKQGRDLISKPRPRKGMMQP